MVVMGLESDVRWKDVVLKFIGFLVVWLVIL